MPSNEVVVLVGGGVMVLAGWTVLMPRHWRGDLRHRELTTSLWLPFSYPLRRGLVRSTPLVMFGFTCLYLSAALSIAIRARTGHDPTGIALWLLGVLVFLSIGMAVIVWPVVVLLNRPKFVVAPVYRSESGAISSWRRARKLRKTAK